MNKLSNESQVRVVAALVEGNSLLSISRMTGIHRSTILNLLADLGKARIRVSGQGTAEFEVRKDPVRRDLVVLRLQREERHTQAQEAGLG